MMGKVTLVLFLLVCTTLYCQGSYSPNKAKNEMKFYYPKMNDKFWFFYDPKLSGAEGWIKEDCDNEVSSGEKVIVVYELIKHSGRGLYKGHLVVKIKENQKQVTIDFKCFKPDYEKGEWLGPDLEIPNWKGS